MEQGQNVTRDNGARIELKCEADSNPEADLTWYKLPDISKVWLSTITFLIVGVQHNFVFCFSMLYLNKGYFN